MLWSEGNSEPASYATIFQLGKFLVAKTRSGLVKLAADLHIDVSREPAHIVDIVRMHLILTKLRPGKALTQEFAEILLESWNALEDMSRSLGIEATSTVGDTKALMQHVYDKVFYGNNLPSLTPKGHGYAPVFNREELAALRFGLRKTWQEICKRSGQFQ